MRVCWVLDLFSLQVFTFGGKLIYVGGQERKQKQLKWPTLLPMVFYHVRTSSLTPLSQGRKKHMTGTRASHIPSEHSDHWDTEPHGRPMTISFCLIRFVLESARSHAETNETVPMLLAARARTHTGHQMSQGRKYHKVRPGLEPRTSRIPCEHSDHKTTKPHGRPVATLTYVILQTCWNCCDHICKTVSRGKQFVLSVCDSCIIFDFFLNTCCLTEDAASF